MVPRTRCIMDRTAWKKNLPVPWWQSSSAGEILQGKYGEMYKWSMPLALTKWGLWKFYFVYVYEAPQTALLTQQNCFSMNLFDENVNAHAPFEHFYFITYTYFLYNKQIKANCTLHERSLEPLGHILRGIRHTSSMSRRIWCINALIFNHLKNKTWAKQ